MSARGVSVGPRLTPATIGRDYNHLRITSPLLPVGVTHGVRIATQRGQAATGLREVRAEAPRPDAVRPPWPEAVRRPLSRRACVQGQGAEQRPLPDARRAFDWSQDPEGTRQGYRRP